MLGIGEIVLLLLVILFAGGAISGLARWALLRRAPGAKHVLSALLDWAEGRGPAEGEDGKPPNAGGSKPG